MRRTAMNTEVYPFHAGDFECIAVSDGTLTYTPPAFPLPAALLFGNAPREPLEQALLQYHIGPEHWTEWINPSICLLVITGDHRGMVDYPIRFPFPGLGHIIPKGSGWAWRPIAGAV
jgi:hypothetical protein